MSINFVEDLLLYMLLKRQIKLSTVNIRGELPIGSISWLGPNWVHVEVQDMDNIVVHQDIAYYNKTSLGS